MPTQRDMQVSLDDARFFCEKIGQIVRGQSEQEQDLKVVHRYFRAYLHCWKCVFDYVREEKGLKETASFRSQCSRKDWIAWVERWKDSWKEAQSSDSKILEILRETRDRDTHVGVICVDREIAGGLFPIAVFPPGRKQTEPPRELISCCERGLVLAEWLISDYQRIP